MLPTLKELLEQISNLFLQHDTKDATCPIWLAQSKKGRIAYPREIDAKQQAWLKAMDFRATAGSWAPLPGEDRPSGVVVGSDDRQGIDAQPLFAGGLPGLLPEGAYHSAYEARDSDLDAIAWALGQYAFQRYQANGGGANPARKLRLAKGVDLDATVNIASAVWLGRDLINTPANDLGPAELADAVRGVADHFDAQCRIVEGYDLVTEKFPLIHAVGRASARAPRLIDLRWGDENAPRVTLVGKGICFDTGGLNIKPGPAMALMKKDMGGAAASISLAVMIMAARLPVRLRLIIPAAENAISGNAFRPGDVLKSRAGLSVEVGDTDAEGRLVLADALALADEEAPDYLISFATLTGAARVALGPDLPPVYSTDTNLAGALTDFGRRLGDAMWPMPLWQPYDKLLDGRIADINSIFPEPFAGSIMAALFLNRFVKAAKSYTHFDIYGWVPRAQAGKGVGGEPQCARAVFDYLKGAFQKA